ncbi:ABC transporter permease [Fictibacillus norfolkensis]|uniref:Iron ABC transporter permease n=1 Tax=Fictibacillus norfolkensis TaxID=2762233 RepID=A0ABR8SH64_9BACL|nr:iron ABC transporter permease [Fictibacillus norfolkensis]MBD7962728.1 iron ABC transporter permease [Fictibacillus norfolkensis]
MLYLIRKMRSQLNSWALLSVIFSTLILLPALLIMIQLFAESNENWEHIKEYMLKNYIVNSVTLVSFTGFFTVLIGVSTAWLVSAYKVPMHRFFKWGLILPLAIPPYIGAYTYHGILNYTGVIQTTLRNQFGIKVDQKYFDIMNIPGAVFIFTMFLYPYVYIITRSFLENQSSSLIENARLLGKGSFMTFIQVVLPVSRAAIVGGVSLVILEVFNDYGVVKYFGIQTFSTAIFQAWFGMGDIYSAIKLAGTLMFIVVLILILEKVIRGRKQYSYSTSKVRPLQPKELKGLKKVAVLSFFISLFALAFAIPFIQLLQWVYMTYDVILSAAFADLIWNSVFVAAIGSVFIIIVALIIANFSRLSKGWIGKLFSKITVLGYSIPGAVIAIGVLTLFLALDEKVITLYEWFGLEPTLVLSLSISMLIFAYVVRFLAVGFNSIESGFDKVGTVFTEASRTLGMSVTKTFFKVDIKMIKGAIAGGFILVFVDILKELPLTLILQPFNFYTLATKTFQYASDERIHEAAVSSMVIICISALSIFFLHRVLEKEPK